jgi:hypothetical protein
MPAGSDAVSRVGKLYAATGNELLRGLPRGETLRGFTRPATLRSFTWGNEKFHFSPELWNCHVSEEWQNRVSNDSIVETTPG